MLKTYKKKGKNNEIGFNDINDIFKSFGNNKDNIIKKLIDENNLIEIFGGYKIIIISLKIQYKKIIYNLIKTKLFIK